MPTHNHNNNDLSYFSTTISLLFFLFFSRYFFHFILFVFYSPFFLITTLVIILFAHSKKLGFVQTVLDKIHSKLNNHIVVDDDNDDDDDDEVVRFDEFEIYKTVFCDPPLMILEDSEKELEKERRLESLFEELDLFEESTMLTSAVSDDDLEQMKVTSSVSAEDLAVERNLESVKLTSALSGDDLEQVKVTSSVSGEDLAVERNLENVKLTSALSGEDLAVERNLENVKLTSALSGEDLTVGNSLNTKSESETVMMTSAFPGDDQLTGRSSFTEKSNSSRFDSSSSFGSYESVDEDSNAVIEIKTTSNRQEFDKLQPVTSPFSGNDQSNSRRLNDSVTSSIKVNNPSQFDSTSSFGSYGSMRKEKEWKRTLACKLFEERRSLEGGEEGMDSLWEVYETDNSSRKTQSKLTNKSKINKKSEFKYFDDGENDEDDDEEEDEFISNGQLCCLKALKLSTGKMNLGMGKPNLVKISKALKGFGWLHHVGSKHGKKK